MGDQVDQSVVHETVFADIWKWLHEFVTVDNEFYDYKFAPCPYAKPAVTAGKVDVTVYLQGDVRSYIRERSIELRDTPKLSTRVMAFPPRIQWQWGISEFVEGLNTELIRDNVFLNTGVTKTMNSRYPGSPRNTPYFIVVANRLDAVLSGARSLQKTDYYKNWPQDQYELVVLRRERMAQKYGNKE
jgi:hypothetical protein